MATVWLRIKKIGDGLGKSVGEFVMAPKVLIEPKDFPW